MKPKENVYEITPDDLPGAPGSSSSRQETDSIASRDSHSLVRELSRQNKELEKQNHELQEMHNHLKESNSKYTELFDQAPIAYLTVDHNIRIMEINLTGANMLGTAKNRLINQFFSEFVVEDYHDVLSNHYRRVFETGDRQACELKLIKKDGPEFYGSLKSTLVYSEGIYEQDRCRTTISDITQRKQAEIALRESKLKNQALLNTIPDIIFIQDKNGVYIDYHAENIASLYALPIRFLGKQNRDIFPAAISSSLDDHMKKALATGQLQSYEYSLPVEDNLHYYETRMLAFGEDNVFSIVRDITPRKQAQMALQQAHSMLERRVEERTAEIREINRQLKREIAERKRMEKIREKAQRLETIGKLAAGVAHEVRNPLNSIQAIVAVLNTDLAENEFFQQCSEHINIQVDRLSQLMKDLLELGKQKPKKEFDIIRSIPHMCHSAVGLWKQSQKEVAHNVTIHCHKEIEDLPISGNKEELERVIINLVENASQHSPTNSNIRLIITRATKRKIKIEVHDQGKGIKKENLTEVFEPFFTKRHSGTGLGLSIVKNIIENHGGTISAHNNTPHPGCTFQIILPLLRQENTGKKNEQ